MVDALTPIEIAIERLGGPTKAAERLGIKHPSVIANWRSRGRPPAEKVLDIEKATGVSRYDLRPDVFGERPEAA